MCVRGGGSTNCVESIYAKPADRVLQLSTSLHSDLCVLYPCRRKQPVDGDGLQRYMVWLKQQVLAGEQTQGKASPNNTVLRTVAHVYGCVCVCLSVTSESFVLAYGVSGLQMSRGVEARLGKQGRQPRSVFPAKCTRHAAAASLACSTLLLALLIMLCVWLVAAGLIVVFPTRIQGGTDPEYDHLTPLYGESDLVTKSGTPLYGDH